MGGRSIGGTLEHWWRKVDIVVRSVLEYCMSKTQPEIILKIKMFLIKETF